MLTWLKQLVDRGNDPVVGCDLYRDQAAGSCAHVHGALCDYPHCSMLADYRRERDGGLVMDGPLFRDDLHDILAEQQGSDGPIPHT